MASPVIQFKRGLVANLPGLQAGEPGFTTDSYDFYIGLTSETSTNKFFGSHRYWTKETTSKGSGVNLVEGTSTGSDFITLKAPDNLSGITTYTFPATPTADYYLKTGADGTLSWAAVSQSSFSGIVTFTDTTDNTFGNANTGAIQIDGGLGVNKNVTVGGNLNVQGFSEFVGVVTFRGGTINIGDGTGDNINVGGEFTSGLFPNDDATYNLGDSSRRWNNANLSGILTAATGAVIDGVQIGINGANVIDTVSGNLTLNSAGGQTIIDDLVTIQNNLTVNGNVTVGGTTVTLRGTDVFIENKDIVLGYTTSVTPNDDTANHAGVAIASTVGSPLVSFSASGINTLSDTYKQMMWFKSGTLGFSTDAFAFNYGLAIGTTSMANGIRFAVGSGITATDNSITATSFVGSLIGNVTGNLTGGHTGDVTGNIKSTGISTFATLSAANINASGIVTASSGFVGGLTGNVTGNINSSGISTFATVSAANVSVSGITTSSGGFVGNLTGNASSADQVKTVTASDNNATYHITFVDANNGSATNETVYTDDGIYYNPGTNTFTTQHALFTGNVTINGTLTGTASTATRAITVDTTATSTNQNYFVPFVDTIAGQTGETLRVGIGLSVNPANGNVGVSSILSVGDVNQVNAFIKAGGGSNALYLYSNGDVSFQAKAIVNEIRSSSDSSTTITLAGLDANFTRDIKVTGITTTGTLKLSGTPGIAITAISSSTSLAENSNSYLPTQAAVKAYIDAIDVDDDLGIAGDSGTGTINLDSQSLTIAGTAGEIETSASGQTITVGLPNTVIVGTALSSPVVKTATIQHSNGTQAATIDTSGNITASQNLTVSGNLYVNGSTTQVNTTSVTVEDRTLELGLVDGSAPGSTTTWDLGVLFNYYDGSAKKSALVWEQGDARFKLGSVISAGADGSGTSDPQITFTTYAPLEIGSLWVNDCAGQSQVISCTGSTRNLVNITIDGGTF